MRNSIKTPEIRFKGFSGAWEQRKFNDTFDITIPNNTFSREKLNYNKGSVLNIHYGDVLIKYGSVLDVRNSDIPFVTGKSVDNFKGALLQDGDVVLADTAEDETVGKACEIGNSQGVNVVSGLHTIACRPLMKIALGYLGYYLNSNVYHLQLLPLMQGIKVLSLSRTNIQKTNINYPVEETEQYQISTLFQTVDRIITLHQHKLEKLQNIKKALLEKMFPRDGSKYPEIRFKGFSDAWEQYLVSNLFKVTRGNVLATSLTCDRKTNETPYPVYSSQTQGNGLMGFYKDYLYEDAITWTTDGANAGTVHYRAGKFYCTNVCGVLLSNKIIANQMVAEALNKVAKNYVSYVGNPKLMNNVMSNVKIVLSQNNKEKELISKLFYLIDHLIFFHQKKLEKLQNIKKALLEKMFV